MCLKNISDCMWSHNDSIDTTHTPPPLSFYNTFKHTVYAICQQTPSEMDLAQIWFIPQIVIKEWGAKVCRKIGPSPIRWDPFKVLVRLLVFDWQFGNQLEWQKWKFIAPLKMIIQNCSPRHWKSIPNFVIAPLPTLVRCKRKGQLELCCPLELGY